jgi:uncharacterized membrane protein
VNGETIPVWLMPGYMALAGITLGVALSSCGRTLQGLLILAMVQDGGSLLAVLLGVRLFQVI